MFFTSFVWSFTTPLSTVVSADLYPSSFSSLLLFFLSSFFLQQDFRKCDYMFKLSYGRPTFIILYRIIYALIKCSSSNEKNKLFWKQQKDAPWLKLYKDKLLLSTGKSWVGLFPGFLDTRNTKTGAREKEKKTRERKRQDMWESQRPWQKYFLNVKFMKYSKFGYVP